MKLGSQTNSVMNAMMSRQVVGEPVPVVGVGCTILAWTDRRAATVLSYEKGILEVQEDHAKLKPGCTIYTDQDYDYSPDPNGRKHAFRKSKKGPWDEVKFNEVTGRWNQVKGLGLKLGVREKFYDPSF